MRPAGPVPWMKCNSTPESHACRRTAGDAMGRSPAVRVTETDERSGELLRGLLRGLVCGLLAAASFIGGIATAPDGDVTSTIGFPPADVVGVDGACDTALDVALDVA